jgi:glycosyltransferase involved in cell wall biosynthesis
MSSPSSRSPSPQIVHLCEKAPHVPGSYNRQIGFLLRALPEFEQRLYCQEASTPLPHSEARHRIVQLSGRGMPLRLRLALTLPVRLRRGLGMPFGSRASQAYAWRVVEELRRCRPAVVMIYDNHKLGAVLRRAIDWPCRLVLHQHGLSYFLDPLVAAGVYSLRSFDSVVVLHRSAYLFDRARMHSYEATVRVVPNFVDTETFLPASAERRRAARAEFGFEEETQVVLALGRLVAKKGVHILLEAWAEVLRNSDRRRLLWVVGGGEPGYRRQLEEMSRSLGIADRVRFEGAVPSDRTASCFAASDLFVLASVCHEGMPLALLEAMASGLPCVSSEWIGLEELIPAGSVAIVAAPNVPQELAAQLSAVLDDDSLSRQLAVRGREVCERDFSVERGLERWRQLYASELALVGRTGAAPGGELGVEIEGAGPV